MIIKYDLYKESLLDKLQGPSKEEINKQFDKFKLKKFFIFNDKVEIKKYFKLAVKIGDLDRVKKVMKTGLLSKYDIDTELFNDSLKCGNLGVIKYLLDNFNIETNILTSYGVIDNKLNYDILNKIINKFNNEQLERLMDLTYKSVNIIDIILILLKNKIVKKTFIDNTFRRACYNNCYDSVYKMITEINYNVNNDEKKGFYMGVVNNNYDIVKLIVNSGLEYRDFDIEICEQMEINDNKNISKIIKLLKDNLKNK